MVLRSYIIIISAFWCGGPVNRPVSGVKDSLGRPGPSSLLTILDTMGVSLLQLPTLLAVYMLDTYMVSTVQFSAVQ